MICGCAGRREWIRRKFSQWANPFANFSVANEAPGKSAEGAWIKSTEGARGFGGLKWFHSRIVRLAGLNYGCSILLHGDVTSSFPTTGYQMEAYEDGALWLVFPTESGTSFIDFSQWGTACGTTQTPDGVTIVDYDSVDTPLFLDVNKSITMRFVNSSDPGDVVITPDPMIHCADETPPGVGADWDAP